MKKRIFYVEYEIYSMFVFYFSNCIFSSGGGRSRTFEKYLHEGVYSPLVRHYAQSKNMTYLESYRQLQYLDSAPEMIKRVFSFYHFHERMTKSSPYVAQSKNYRTAAFHSAFGKSLKRVILKSDS